VYDISYADNLLARFRSDDTLARSDKQHLVAAMDVQFVPRTGTEVDDGEIEVVAHLWRQQRLSRHGTAREQGTIRWFCRDLIGFDYLHWRILLPVFIFMSQSAGCSSRSQPVERLERLELLELMNFLLV
jgi:hypothetical protein